MAKLTLPLPPSTNHIFHNKRKGGRGKTKEYKAWMNECLWMTVASRRELPEPTKKERYTVLIHVRTDDCRDLDNFLKPVIDFLQAAGVIYDDRYVYRIEASKENISGGRGREGFDVEVLVH